MPAGVGLQENNSSCRRSDGGNNLMVRQAWRTARKRHSLGCGGPVATWGCSSFSTGYLAIVPYGP
jgi:hypothetical protein